MTLKPPPRSPATATEPAAVAGFVHALSILCAHAGKERATPVVAAAVQSAAAQFSGHDLLMNAGEALGLRMRSLRAPASELVHQRNGHMLPVATVGSDGLPLVIVSADSRGARVHRGKSFDAPEHLSWSDVESLIAPSKTPEDSSSFVAPLWALADPDPGLESIRADITAPHGSLSPIKRLIALAKLERSDISVAVVYAIGVGLLSLATPLCVQFLVNSVAFGTLVQPLIVLSTIVLAGLVFAGVLKGLQAIVVERIQQRIFARVALDLADRLPRVNVDVLDGRHGPELVNRFMDVTTIQKGAATMLTDGVAIVLQTLVGTLLLAFYHPFLLGFDVALLSALTLVIAGLGRGAIKTAKKESNTKYDLVAWIQETARHVETFKLQHGDALARGQAEALTKAYIEARRKHFRIAFRQFAGVLTIQATASAALLGIGGWLVISRQLTLGQLVAAELIVSAVVAGFSKLGKYLETFYDLVVSVDKVGMVLDLPTETEHQSLVPAVTGAMAVRASGLAVRHSGGAVLEGIHLDLKPGRSALIVAKSGSGKSALVDALLAVRTHERGRIDIDGVSIDDLARVPFRRSVAVVRLDGLFAGTIAENLGLGRIDISRHDMRVVLESLGVWDTVCALPNGLDTAVATHGKGLAGELAHLLLLARALLGKPRLLILDGVLDVLAPSGLAAIRHAVLAPNRPWSVLVTSTSDEHRSWFDDMYEIDHETLVPSTNFKTNTAQVTR